MNEDKLRRTLLHVVGMLVRGEYEALSHFSGGKRLWEEMIRRVVEEWPDRLVMPPANEVGARSYGEVTGSYPKAWWVDVDLWTEAEGRSDLTLSLTLVDSPGELYRVEIDDLHVM